MVPQSKTVIPGRTKDDPRLTKVNVLPVKKSQEGNAAAQPIQTLEPAIAPLQVQPVANTAALNAPQRVAEISRNEAGGSARGNGGAQGANVAKLKADQGRVRVELMKDAGVVAALLDVAIKSGAVVSDAEKVITGGGELNNSLGQFQAVLDRTASEVREQFSKNNRRLPKMTGGATKQPGGLSGHHGGGSGPPSSGNPCA